MRYTIAVTQAHMDNGIPGDPCACPIALAARDAGTGLSTSVGQHSLWNHPIARDIDEILNRTPDANYSLWRHVELPEDVSQWIWDLDDGQTVEPFSFEIELPEDWGAWADAQA